MPFVRIDFCLTAGRCGRALVEKTLDKFIIIV